MKINPNTSARLATTGMLAPMAQRGLVAKANAASATGVSPTSGGTTAPESGGAAQLGGPSMAIPPAIDMQAFYAAWGSDNADFDVTKDGTVDGKDLAVFLSAAQQSPEQAVAAGVQQAWGTANAKYDLNSDGTVDGADLTMALSGVMPKEAKPSEGKDADQGGPSEEAAAIAKKATEGLFASHDADGDGQLAAGDLPGARRALGSLDADRDGKISRDEIQSRLSTALTSLARNEPSADLEGAAQRWVGALLGQDPAAGKAYSAAAGQVDPRADRLFRQLSAQGFAAAPPSNLNDLIAGIAPGRAERTSMMRGLAHRYPNGLGVNARA